MQTEDVSPPRLVLEDHTLTTIPILQLPGDKSPKLRHPTLSYVLSPQQCARIFLTKAGAVHWKNASKLATVTGYRLPQPLQFYDTVTSHGARAYQSSRKYKWSHNSGQFPCTAEFHTLYDNTSRTISYALLSRNFYCYISIPHIHYYTPSSNNIGSLINYFRLKPTTIHKLVLKGGGSSRTTSNGNTITQHLLLPTHSSIRGPLRIDNLPPHPIKHSWQPSVQLYYKRSNHPLDIGLSTHHTSIITQYCQLPSEMILASSIVKPTVVLTSHDLRNLLTHGQPTNDNTIYLFLEIFCSFFNYTFLTEKFLTLLNREGWQKIRRYFSNAKKSKERSTYGPDMSGEPAIAIPCFINGAHWIALVRREIQGQVYFLYSDDLNNPSSEAHIRQILSEQTDDTFYPPSAKWINCRAFTYSPHSNECGPRTLLAISVMLLHPEPAANILLEYMSPNLAQITRTWVAATILTGQPIIPPLLNQHHIQILLPG